jgi:hypothetical protein
MPLRNSLGSATPAASAKPRPVVRFGDERRDLTAEPRAIASGVVSINLTSALEMAAAGIPVFPMLVFKDDRGKWNKKPAIKGWRTKATTDRKVIKRWAREFPRAVFAIELEKAGLVVIDCDRHRDGADGCKAFKELVEANGGGFSKAPMTQTSGGWHFFFRQPAVPIGYPVKTELPAGVEVKGAGGNIVVPGSLRPDGAEWRPIATHGRPTCRTPIATGWPSSRHG